MFGIGTRSKGRVVAVAHVASGSAGVAIFESGAAPRLVSFARETLPLEKRSDDALASGVLQALQSAGEKALAAYRAGAGSAPITICYCIVSAPWTRSFTGEARANLQPQTAVSDMMIAELAKRALAAEKNIGTGSVFEATVMRILLNGYPTEEPAGKHASDLRVYTLASDCNSKIQDGAKEALAKLFPGATPTWRSSARAALSVTRQARKNSNYLLVEVDTESADVACVRKGVLTERALVLQGMRQIAASLAGDRPAEEVIALLDMHEKQQSEPGASSELEQALAKFEPELAHSFGETFAKLSNSRKLPEELILIAPAQLSRWLSRFFSRIDFTQFIATTMPFSVSLFSFDEYLPAMQTPASFADPGLSIACAFVNTELSS